ncbi:MAG: segregation/condensation protein A, partial [Verrucomicrobiota bacterium]
MTTEQPEDIDPASAPGDDSEARPPMESQINEFLHPAPDASEEPVPSGAGDKPEMLHQYKVALEIFEGPMDLLLYLIKKDEIDIYDISIERITQQYMAYIDTFKMLNIALAGEFLVMAANLCYIKSRMMLPKHVQPPEDDADEEDPRWDLIRQLIEYKKFKDAADQLGDREEAAQRHFRNHPDKIESDEPQERPLSDDLGIFDLIRAFQNILDRFADDGLGEIVDDHFTVSDKIDFLLETVLPGQVVQFESLFAEASTKNEVIVTFLAMLEMMKINHLRVLELRTLTTY